MSTRKPRRPAVPHDAAWYRQAADEADALAAEPGTSDFVRAGLLEYARHCRYLAARQEGVYAHPPAS